ncbi:hypothetical protein D3C84_718360 [compost metagenome]
MGLDAAQGQVEPFLPQCPQHHADGLALVLEYRPLFDMRFEIGAHRMAGDRPWAGVADGIEGLPHADALGVGLGQGFGQGEFPGEHPRAHHAGGKARALLVGPDHHFQRRLGLDLEVVERAHHFQARQHAEAAVELAAGGLGVDVAAGHHRRQLRVAPSAPGKDIAHPIDADAAPGLLGPLHEQIAGLSVEVGQRQPADPALDRSAEAGQVHQRRPQAVTVDVPLGGLQNLVCCAHVVLHVREKAWPHGPCGCRPRCSSRNRSARPARNR